MICEQSSQHENRKMASLNLRYAALDLECATSDVGNICEVGLVVMENGVEIQHFRSLVRPVIESFGDWQRWNFDYGLSDTLKAPEFPVVWNKISDMIGDIPVVAHNAQMVECKHLASSFSHHGMDASRLPSFYCTLELARKVWPDLDKHGIKFLSKQFQWKLDHHNPESDARVCAAVVEKAIAEAEFTSWEELKSAHQWKACKVVPYPKRIEIKVKSAQPRTREDYLHELILWQPTVELEAISQGQRFVLSGFDQAKKSKLRKAGQERGLLNKRYIKGPIDFLVADEKMGAAKYARCQRGQIPILTESEFLLKLNDLPKHARSVD